MSPILGNTFCASGRVERPPSEHESNMRPLHQLAETNSRVGRVNLTSASLRFLVQIEFKPHW